MTQEENSKKRQLFAIRLKGLRGRRGLNQSELAAKIGVSAGSVGNWEAEENLPQMPVLRKLSEFFGVPIAFLIDEKTALDKAAEASAHASAAAPDLVLKEGASFYKTHVEGLPNLLADAEAFWLQMFGDSMEPRVLAGDHLLVSPNAAVESGDLVMVKKDSGEISVRIYIGGAGGEFTLVAYNPIYPAQECRQENFKWVYAVCFVLRIVKVRGLYEGELKAAPAEKENK
jgi:transcriptional regulator with XRE-family HTH domain